MKKILYASLALAVAGSVAATVLVPVKVTPRETLELIKSTECDGVSSRRATPAKAPVVAPYIFAEDFEEVSASGTYPLPSGWTTISTPGHDDSHWLGATLAVQGSSEAMPGTSGTKYAVLMGQDYSIDSWMFTPAIHMEAGKKYDVYFSVYKPQAASTVVSTFSVSLGKAPQPEAMTDKLMTEGRSIGNWVIYNRPVTPSETGDYHIGFHTAAGPRSYITVVDDVMVCESAPRFYGPSTLDFPDKTSSEDEVFAEMTINNIGSAPLTLEADESSPELEIVQMPATVAERTAATIKARLTSKETGAYEGFIKIKTNDPLNPTVTVNCRGNVTESVVTSYWFENFEKGTPAGWDLTDFYFHPSKGVNGSTCLENWNIYTCDIYTHYINMGANPIIAFAYKAQKYDVSGADPNTSPTRPEYVKINVYVSDDYGKTFERVYRIAPEDGDMKHVLSYDFANVSIPVPAYKDKVCQVKIEVEKSKQFMTDDYGILIDNVEIGTAAPHDIVAGTLFGPGIIKTGKTAAYTLNLQNQGTETVAASDYTVRLLNDKGKELASTSGIEIAKGASASVTLKITPAEAASFRIHAVVEYAADNNPNNNSSVERQIGVVTNTIGQTLPSDINPQATGYGVLSPVNYYFKNCAVQTLYYANYINASEGTLQGISFTMKNDADFVSPSIDVWIGETDRNNFSDGKFVDPSTLTHVYSGAVDMPKGETEFDIPFETPYEWKGRNIVVYMAKNSTNFFPFKMFYASNDPRVADCSISLTDDKQEIDPMNPGQGTPAGEIAIANFHWSNNDNYGTIKGKVTDAAGPVANARVLLEGTSYFAVTDASGTYTLDRVAIGEVTLAVDAYGHDSKTGVEISVEKGTVSTADINLAVSSRHEVKFALTDEKGNPLAGFEGRLIGYANYKAVSDAEGILTFPAVYDREEAYDFAIETAGYLPYYKSLTVSKDINESITLSELRNAPTDFTHEISDGKITLKWNAPLDEFGYDNGVVVEKLGYDQGNKTSLIGVAFNNNAVIEEVSWYTNNTNNPHPTVNVYVLALDETGRPTANILAGVEGVANVDGGWNSYKFPKRVEAPNGFYVGVSCDGGFLGLAVGGIASDSGLRRGQFWTTSEFTFQAQPGTGVADGLWVDNYGTANGNYVPMIRVKGEDLGYIDRNDYSPKTTTWFSAPARTPSRELSYRVELDGNIAGSDITGHEISFDAPAAGKHKAAVYAIYKSGDSMPVEISFDTSGVGNIEYTTVGVGPNPFAEYIEIYGWEHVNRFKLYSIDGQSVFETEVKSARIDISGLPHGVYIGYLSLLNGDTVTYKLIHN